jgi:hypothetical protein
VRELQLNWSRERITVELEQWENYCRTAAARKLQLKWRSERITVELDQ